MTGIVDRILNVLLVLVLGAMAVIVAGNVFFRFILNASLYWADELAQILLVWLTFLGAALAVKEKSHYMLNFLIEKLNGNTKKFCWFFQQVMILTAIAILLYYSTIVSFKIRLWVMPATEISRFFVYAACPIGCLMMLYYSILNIISSYKKSEFEKD
ncbi:TRAP transporter small permease [Maribacter sp. LLG6340-A2]|uniref:TRAP transporter small permease n=1 Tax=Maribacter sp. LLG6340-A2 TaxID=3160834 RepID=UPI00386A2598